MKTLWKTSTRSVLRAMRDMRGHARVAGEARKSRTTLKNSDMQNAVSHLETTLSILEIDRLLEYDRLLNYYPPLALAPPY